MGDSSFLSVRICKSVSAIVLDEITINNTCNPNVGDWSDSNLTSFEPTTVKTVTTTPWTVTTTTSMLTTTVTNFYENYCRDIKLRSSKFLSGVTLKTEDDWGVIFKRGVPYNGVAILNGISAFPELSGSYEIIHGFGAYKGPIKTYGTFYPSQPCVAKPMQSVTCKYIAYKAHIEVGYTVHWKNASPTRGIYKGQGWKFVMRETFNIL